MVELTATKTVVFWPGWTGAKNPFAAMLRDSLISQGHAVSEAQTLKELANTKAEIIQLHWPEQVAWISGSHVALLRSTILTLVAIAILKARRKRVFWIVHNLRPHELKTARRGASAIAARAYQLAASTLLTLSPRTTSIVARHLGTSKPVKFVRHPRWAPYPSRKTSREALGYSDAEVVYTYFGDVRPNKGVPDLVTAFRARPPARERLVIVGSTKPDVADTIRRLVSDDPRVTLHLEYLDREVLETIISGADWIVLPFGDYLHSSSLVQALSHGVPVITPASAYADGLAADVGSDWLKTYKGKLRAEDLSQVAPANPLDLSLYECSAVGRHLAEIYEEHR